MISSNLSVQNDGTTNGTLARSLLVVDDEAPLRSALRRFFMRRGWNVSEAEDGECARAMLLDGDRIGGGFDAVLTDMRMPRLSGIALHDLVVRADPAIGSRFIFSSGDTGGDEALEFFGRTHCPVVPKPFELAALLSLVERVATDSVRTDSEGSVARYCSSEDRDSLPE